MDTKTTVLAVQGMTCGSCMARVNRALRDIPGIAKIDVRLREGTVTVTHEATTAALVDALREAGYPATEKATEKLSA